MKILVVDDTEVNCKLLHHVLTSEGWSVTVCLDGKSALEALEQETFDLVISDVLMPEMDGYELCRAVRQNPAWRQICFVMYSSSYLSPEDRSFGLEIGANDFLDKGMSIKELVRRVREAAKRGAIDHSFDQRKLAEADFLNRHRDRLREKLEETDEDLNRRMTELRDLQARVAVWLAASPAVIYSLRIDGPELIPQWVSPNVKLLIGCDAVDALNRRWWIERVHPEDRERLQTHVMDWFEGGAVAHEYRFLHHDGQYRWLRDEQRLVRDELGAPREIVGSWTDITARRTLNARLEQAREDESGRIAREVHDELGQTLTSLNIDLHWLKQRIEQVSDVDLCAAMRKRVTAALALTASTMETIQRISSDLRPSVLDNLGLLAALEWKASEFASRLGLKITWNAKSEVPNLTHERATAMFRVFQEALINIARHAQATAVTLALRPGPGRLVLEIRDNGLGFSEEKLRDPKSLGLLGMRERTQLAGGDFAIQSAPGNGTTVTVSMPMETS